MPGPSGIEWGLREIEQESQGRASRLAEAGSPEALIDALDNALSEALLRDLRIGFDGIDNNLASPRITIQFPVSSCLYDWFFNSRTGYRAQYWISADTGHKFNVSILSRLRATIERQLRSSNVDGREIWVVQHNDHRKDVDKGPRTESKSTVLQSLSPGLAKIWICERLIQNNGEPPRQMPFGSMDPKLQIARWRGSGLFAPFPEEGSAWLDVKGGYVSANGQVSQPNKSPEFRSQSINTTGWT